MLDKGYWLPVLTGSVLGVVVQACLSLLLVAVPKSHELTLTHFLIKRMGQILISHAQKPPLNPHADKGVRGFGLGLHIHPYFMYASSEGSCAFVQACLSLHCTTML